MQRIVVFSKLKLSNCSTLKMLTTVHFSSFIYNRINTYDDVDMIYVEAVFGNMTVIKYSASLIMMENTLLFFFNEFNQCLYTNLL